MKYLNEHIIELAVIVLFFVFYIFRKLYMLKHKYRLGGKSRQKKLSEFAMLNGLRYDRKDTLLELEKFSSLDIFSGRNKVFEHILRGTTWRGETILFDFFIEKENGRLLSATAAVFNVNMLKLCDFKLYYTDNWDLISEHTMEPEKFSESFSDMYAIFTHDEETVSKFFTPELQNFFVKNGGWTIEVKSGWLMISKGAKPCPAAKYKNYIDEIFTVFDNLKNIKVK